MPTHPVGELGLTEAAGGEIDHDAFLFVKGGIDFGGIENQKRLHGGVPYALVAIDERMTLDKREAERRRFLNQRGIQIDTTEGGLGLGDSRLERTEISDTGWVVSPVVWKFGWRILPVGEVHDQPAAQAATGGTRHEQGYQQVGCRA